MSEKDDGGPGPQIKMPDVTPENGVTLRDWFAGQALAGGQLRFENVPDWQLTAWFGKLRANITRAEIMAAGAYDVADAMLAARKREGS